MGERCSRAGTGEGEPKTGRPPHLTTCQLLIHFPNDEWASHTCCLSLASPMEMWTSVSEVMGDGLYKRLRQGCDCSPSRL